MSSLLKTGTYIVVRLPDMAGKVFFKMRSSIVLGTITHLVCICAILITDLGNTLLICLMYIYICIYKYN